MPEESLRQRPEVIIGLVGALGTDLKYVSEIIANALLEFSYKSTEISLSQLLRDFPDPAPFPKPLKESPEEERLDSYMSAGNALRNSMEQGDAVVRLAISKMREFREKHHTDLGTVTNTKSNEDDSLSNHPIANHAFILRSLKHSDEAKTLRKVYGESFFLIAVYSPRARRQAYMAKKIADSHSQFRVEGHEGDALKLLERDEDEIGNKFGQQVRKTFWRGDAYVDASRADLIDESIRRILQLWFGYPFHTPTIDEYMMFSARAAAHRSASLGRQVGAVVATPDGSLISTGTNEVPKAGGGQYWSGDVNDARDHVEGTDSSDIMRRELLEDILNRLGTLGLLSKESADTTPQDLVLKLLYGENPIMQAAEFNSLTEFQRPVHAEMSALIDAARRGVAVAGATLYSTTFPCHGCARHIVAAGISKVVYIEPYVKSLAKTLHSDSIAIDEAYSERALVQFVPFVGLAPRRYMELFKMRDRKDDFGKIVRWNPQEAEPNIGGWANRLSVINEQGVGKQFEIWRENFESNKMTEEANRASKNLGAQENLGEQG